MLKADDERQRDRLLGLVARVGPGSVVRDALDVLAQGPETVAMGHHQHRPAPGPFGQQVGHEGVLPVGNDP